MKVETSLYYAFHSTAVQHPEATALYYQNHAFSYKKVLSRIDAFAHGLKDLGVKEKDVITIVAPNIPQCVYALYAANKVKAVAYLIHPLTPAVKLKTMMETTRSRILITLNINGKRYQDIIHDSKITTVLCSPAYELGTLINAIYLLKNNQETIKPKSFAHALYDKDILAHRQPQTEILGDCHATAVYLNSGGTTGEPRIIELSSYAINALNSNDEAILGINDFVGQYMFDVLPIFHGFGLAMGLHAMLTHGGTVTLIPKFNADDTIKLINKGKVNYIVGVPALYESLLAHPKFNGPGLTHLITSFVGGDFVAESLLERFNQRLAENHSKGVLFEGYGLTEVVTVCNVNTVADHKKGTVGHPLANIQNKIIDRDTLLELPAGKIGEIYVSGETMMNGYFGVSEQPFIFDKDGKKWVATGDIGYRDEDGYLVFKQRIKRLLKVYGVNVFPSEIEQAATSLKGIVEACAVGITDSIRGSRIRLYLKAVEGTDTTGYAEKLSALIKETISVYSVPKEIVYVKALPKTLIGKVDYKALADENYHE
ncbi:MAG: class I adenylate-forming enzyme family protein [Firmicutes bacterium]|nr:class I adenylate-forming enzyme family protein [Bacillota bacterium]